MTFLKTSAKILIKKITILQYEHKISMEKSSCLKSTVNFIANFEWVKNRVLLSSGPMVISLTFLSASAVSSGTCTSSPHPSLKNMSARAHRGMAKACFTVTKSPVNNLNGSQWMSPALSRDDTIQRQVPINFSWASEGLVGRSVLWKQEEIITFVPHPASLCRSTSISRFLTLLESWRMLFANNTTFIHHEMMRHESESRSADASGAFLLAAIVWL